MNAKRWCGVLGTWCLVLSGTVAAQNESIATVRDLYASAAYEDALSVLGRLPQSRTSDESRAIEQYRAFCLLALGRAAEAERAIATVVQGQPSYRPADAEMSPRLRNAFIDVRKKLLPQIIQQRYADAKGAFDRREFLAASQGFQQVLDLMGDPDVALAAGQPPLSDMRVLAKGFHDLSASAATPPPLPSSPVVAPQPKNAVADASSATAPTASGSSASAASGVGAAPVAPAVYVAGDTRVVPPVTIRQELPAYPGVITIGKQGVIEVIIDENGLVESAVMRVPVTPNYDALALAATKTWRYKPAVANGAPVKFRKAVQITVRPQGRS